jgi:hypothetical protein
MVAYNRYRSTDDHIFNIEVSTTCWAAHFNDGFFGYSRIVPAVSLEY